jgi:hypothetical protein
MNFVSLDYECLGYVGVFVRFVKYSIESFRHHSGVLLLFEVPKFVAKFGSLHWNSQANL